MTNANNDSNTTLEQLKDKILQFSIDRDWSAQDPRDTKNFTMALTVEAAELMEIFQWAHTEDVEQILKDEAKFTHIKEEVADVFWYLMRICNCAGIDLTQAVIDKEQKNAIKYPPVK